MKKIKKILNSVKWFGLRKLYWTIRRIFVGNVLVSKDVIQNIINTYDGYIGHGASYSKGSIGLGLIHYSIVINIRPKRILCIGSRKGFIPAILALACRDVRGGHVDFVDAGYGDENPEKSWTGIGFWKDVDAKGHFGKIAVSKYITTHVMTTKEFLKSFPRKRYEYIYIDGDHSYDGVFYDYANFWKKLEKGGFMAFHDISEEGVKTEGEYGVKKLWRQIAKKSFVEINVDSGLGLIQKT